MKKYKLLIPFSGLVLIALMLSFFGAVPVFAQEPTETPVVTPTPVITETFFIGEDPINLTTNWGKGGESDCDGFTYSNHETYVSIRNWLPDGVDPNYNYKLIGSIVVQVIPGAWHVDTGQEDYQAIYRPRYVNNNSDGISPSLFKDWSTGDHDGNTVEGLPEYTVNNNYGPSPAVFQEGVLQSLIDGGWIDAFEIDTTYFFIPYDHAPDFGTSAQPMVIEGVDQYVELAYQARVYTTGSGSQIDQICNDFLDSAIVVYPVFYGIPPNLPEIEPTITPTPFPGEECDWVDWQPYFSAEGIDDLWSYPMGASAIRAAFSDTVQIDWSTCSPGLPYSVPFYPGEWVELDRQYVIDYECPVVVQCPYISGGCAALTGQHWQYKPGFCSNIINPGDGLIPIDPSAGGGGIGIEVVYDDCATVTFSEFALTDTLSLFVNTFNVPVPDIGYQAGQISICLEAYEITQLGFGGIDFLPFVSVMLGMVTLIIIAMIVRR